MSSRGRTDSIFPKTAHGIALFVLDAPFLERYSGAALYPLFHEPTPPEGEGTACRWGDVSTQTILLLLTSSAGG